MKIINIVSNKLEENSYIVFDREEKIAVIIDPGSNLEEYEREIEKWNLKLKYILLTHCHHDHTEGVRALKKRYEDVEVCIHENDFRGLLSPKISHAKYVIEADVKLKDKENIHFGTYFFKTINTPGHTKGSSCFELFDKDSKSLHIIFTGDTLFLDDIGRWDLATGSEFDMKNSIIKIISKWSGITKIYTGHGPNGNMNKVKKINRWYLDIINKKV